jgi:hypothetical protein
MSADNEIAVVKFPDGYRVAMVFGCPSISDTFHLYDHAKAFEESVVFGTEEEAIEYACGLVEEEEKDGGYVEYGVTLWEAEHPIEHYLRP